MNVLLSLLLFGCLILCANSLPSSSLSSSPLPLSVGDGAVLVLGSGGLVGKSLTEWLRKSNYQVAEVRNRRHIDLRIPDSLDVFNSMNISFAFFLACEVGGSKFIDSHHSNIQLDILRHNLAIYDTVFEYLSRRSIPFLFTSSYLQSQPTSYGTVKRLGEAWMNAIHSGKIVRLWNIYGPEKLGPRSHVLGDWIHACLTRHSIQSMTDGKEARQFLHTDDAAKAMVLMMENYHILDHVTDLSSGEWVTMRTVASLVSETAPRNVSCSAQFADIKAVARARLSPKVKDVPFYKLWTPTITLQEGISRLFVHYDNILQSNETRQDDEYQTNEIEEDHGETEEKKKGSQLSALSSSHAEQGKDSKEEIFVHNKDDSSDSGSHSECKSPKQQVESIGIDIDSLNGAVSQL